MMHREENKETCVDSRAGPRFEIVSS